MDISKTLEERFRTDYKRWYSFVKRSNITPELAEDAIQEACCRALKYQHTFRSEQASDVWFYSILRNALRDVLRDDKRIGMTNCSDEFWEAPSGVSLEVQRISEEVRLHIESLEDPHRSILYLYFYEGLSPKEINELVEVKGSTLRMCVMRFKDYLRDTYGETMYC